jgi:hypothetical protein
MSSEFREKSAGERHIYAQQHIMVLIMVWEMAVVLIMVFAKTLMNKGETPFSATRKELSLTLYDSFRLLIVSVSY